MIKDEIAKLMKDFNRDTNSGKISASFEFPDSFTGFSGHFPGNPVLPGVCQIECILVLIEKHCNSKVTLSDVSRARFTNPVMPGMKISVSGLLKQDDQYVSGKFTITGVEKNSKVNISRISLTGKILTQRS